MKKTLYQKNNVGFILYIIIIVFSLNIIPLIFGNKITISPLLIFGIILICHCSHYLIHLNKPEKETSTNVFDQLFFASLAVSGCFSLVLVLIYQVAMLFA